MRQYKRLVIGLTIILLNNSNRKLLIILLVDKWSDPTFHGSP